MVDVSLTPRPKTMNAFWKSVRRPLAQSRIVKHVLATLIANAFRFVKLTNPPVAGSADWRQASQEISPGIVAFWHGQHFLAPTLHARGHRLVAMVSRSADAELNAMVLEKLGVEIVRGSGGRDHANHVDKGGARALIALKRALDAGKNVAMIADIPKGTPREAGLGIVTLAKLSGCPVVPAAVTTSRRLVLENSWDKTTICLPFGRAAMVVGTPVLVPANANPAEMERKRQEITDGLNAATEKAYQMADAVR